MSNFPLLIFSLACVSSQGHGDSYWDPRAAAGDLRAYHFLSYAEDLDRLLEQLATDLTPHIRPRKGGSEAGLICC